jgi:hypothetical protein
MVLRFATAGPLGLSGGFQLGSTPPGSSSEALGCDVLGAGCTATV